MEPSPKLSASLEQGVPPSATGTSLTEVRRLAEDALHGIWLALREAEFADSRLAHVLLVHELRRSVDRAFGTVPTCSAHRLGGPYGRQQHPAGPHGPYGAPQ